MGGTVGSFDCEGDVAEKDRSSKEESKARVRSSNEWSKAPIITAVL